MTAGGNDHWEEGNLYEPYIGRWSRLVAAEFLAWLDPAPNLEWIDVGCGTGALTAVILEKAYPSYITCVDPSTGFIEHARAHIGDPRVTFDIADARRLPVDSARFDVAVAGLVLNFVPQPSQAVREMVRAVRAGGLVAAYVWDYAGKMELMRYFWDAAIKENPGAFGLDEARRFPLCSPGSLRDLFAQAELEDIRLIAIDIPTTFRDFDEYWTPFLGGQGPAPAYAMSLSEEHRMTLREILRASLPIARDGSISLVARAWAIRGSTVKRY